MRNKHLLSKVLLLVAVMLAGVGTAWADGADVTYDFTGSDWQVSDGVLSNGTASFSGEGNANFKMNDGYFIMGKSGAYINFPTYESAVQKIVVTGKTGASAKTKMNIYVGETAVSTETTGSTGTNSYEIASNYQAAGTQYTLKVTSAYNAQITKIEVFYASASNTFTVTYNANGATSGDVPVDNNEYDADNNTATVLGNTGNLQKTGYTFDGWNTKADGTGTDYAAGASLTLTASVNLFAKWVANTYSVTLPEADEYGEYTMDATNPVAYGTAVTLAYTPAEGYESYQATWYVNGEKITGNSFTMPNEAVSVTASVQLVEDYVTLPFSWEGGSSSDLTDILGITASGLGSDYASDHDPYLVKFDHTGDYIQIKTDSQPGVVTIGVKMIGGATASSITVQGSADGETFTNVETLSISGSQNAVLELASTRSFAANVRYVRLYFNKGANVGVGPISISKPSTDTAIEAAETVELEAEATSGEIAYSINNPVSGTSLTASKNVDWITSITVAADKVTFTTTANEGEEREGVITLTYGTLTHDVTVTQAAPVQTVSYTLAKAVVPGRHYIIVGEGDGYLAMGQQNSNNRAAVRINVSDETARVASNDGVCEFVIDVDDAFTIYDPTYTTETTVGGYLYAASGSSNHLKTEAEHDSNNNSKWTISIDEEDGVATIKALGTSSRNWMQYNPSNSLFACYDPTKPQNDVYLYERVGDQAGHEVTKTVSIAQACTDGEKYYATYSSPFAFTVPNDVTASEIAVDNDGVLTVTDYAADAVIPACTGVMLSSATAGEKTITYANGGTAVTENNCLRPSLLGIDATKMSSNDANSKFYRLTMHNGEQIGFWWGAAEGAAFAVAANKAYLAVPNSAAGVRQGFAFGAEATGIATLQTAAGQQPVYNLQGQRVAQPQKGLYIVNGKKVLNK